MQTVLHTAGNGLWSRKATAVTVTNMVLSYVDEEKEFGELQVYFDTRTWNTNIDGLIYTDKLFQQELRIFLVSQGFSESAAYTAGYSEQGMQGDNYVSFDIGEIFIDTWENLFGEIVVA